MNRMRLKKRLRKGFLFAIILLVSCDNSIQDDSENQIYPIHTDNTWTYRRTYVLSTDNVFYDTITMKVEEPVEVNGMSCFKFLNIEMHSMAFQYYIEDVKYVCYLSDNIGIVQLAAAITT